MSDSGATHEGETRLTVRSAIGRSLSLLTRAERRQYRLAVGAQMATALLDLMGVLVIGFVGWLAATSAQDAPLPQVVEEALARIGLGSMSIEALTGALAIAGAGLLLLKSAVYGLLTHRIYRFLGASQGAAVGRVTKGLFTQPLIVLEARTSQETSFALTGGASAAFLGILGSLAIILAEGALLIVLSTALVLVNLIVTIAALVFLAGVGLSVQRGLSAWSRRLGGQLATTSIASYQAVQESIASHREVFVTNRRGLFITRISRLLSEYSRALSDTYFASQIPKLAYESALVVGAVVLTGWQFLTVDRVTAITTLAVFLAAGSRIVPSMLRVSVQSAALSSAVGQAASTFALAETVVAADTMTGSTHTHDVRDAGVLAAAIARGYAGFKGSVSVRELEFTYPGAAEPTVAGVTLHADPGTSVALVGSTGSGKSTLADLMLGILKPDHGKVELGGISPGQAISTWPGSIGYVPQNVVLSNATVRENVALGFDSLMIDDDLVWGALAQAQLADFLVDIREGLDTRIGERGLNLSGGQRQRLGLARALYSRPKLLVLDEATSALDAETEAAITRAMSALSGDVTMITVAHRLATVQHSDQVVFLDAGRVEFIGTFDEVRRAIPQFDRQAHLLGL